MGSDMAHGMTAGTGWPVLYVRIYTKGADLPDGTPMLQRRLEMLEKFARDKGEGAWGLKAHSGAK